MLSSSLYTMLKLSKTSSPKNTVRLWLHNAVLSLTQTDVVSTGWPSFLPAYRLTWCYVYSQARVQDFTGGSPKNQGLINLARSSRKISCPPFWKNSTRARTRFFLWKSTFKVIFMYFKRVFRLFSQIAAPPSELRGRGALGAWAIPLYPRRSIVSFFGTTNWV